MPQEQNKKLYILWWIFLWVILLIVFIIRRIISDWQSEKFIENKVQPIYQQSQEYQSGYDEYMSLTWFSIQLPERIQLSDYQLLSKRFLELWVKEVSTWKVVSQKKIEFGILENQLEQNVNFWIITQDFERFQNLLFLPRAVDYPVVYAWESLQLPSSVEVSQLQLWELQFPECGVFYIPVWTLDKTIYQKSINLYPWFLDVVRILYSQTWLVSTFAQQKSSQDRNLSTSLVRKNVTPMCWLECLIDKNLICWSILMKSTVTDKDRLWTLSYINWLPWYLYWRKSTVPLWKNIVDELYRAWVYFWLHPVTNTIIDEKENWYDSGNGLFIGWLTWTNQ